MPQKPVNLTWVNESLHSLLCKNVKTWQNAAIVSRGLCGFDNLAKIVPAHKTDPSTYYQANYPDFGLDFTTLNSNQLNLIAHIAPNLAEAYPYYITFKEEMGHCTIANPSLESPWNTLKFNRDPMKGLLNHAGGRMENVLSTLFNSMTNSYGRYLFNTTDEVSKGTVEKVVSIETPIELVTLMMVLGPLPVLFLFPFYLLIPFIEKESNLIGFFRVNGLRLLASWTGHLLFNMALSTILVLLLSFVMLIAFPHVSPLIFIIVCLQGSYALVSVAFFTASLPFSPNAMRTVSFTTPILFSLLGAVFTLSEAMMTWSSLLFPVLPFLLNLKRVYLGISINWWLFSGALVTSTIYLGLGIAAMSMDFSTDLKRLLQRIQLRKVEKSKSGREDAESHGTIEDVGVQCEKDRLLDINEASTAEDSIQVINVSKRYGAHQVLRNIFLGVHRGTVFGLLGHNGAGKSTLINVLMGATQPSNGVAYIAGIPSSADSELSTLLGVCPQNDMVIPDLTVEENLLFFARIRGGPLRGLNLSKLVQQSAILVGLDGSLQAKAHTLSGGMRRRLSIAIAFIGAPAVILADEPSAGLDPANRLGIWELIHAVRHAGDSTILISTHSMIEADTLCSRIGIMAQGQLRALGSQVSLKNKYGEGFKLHVQVPTRMPLQGLQNALEPEVRALDALTDALSGFLQGLSPESSPVRLEVTQDLDEDQALSRAMAGQKINGDTHWEVRASVTLPTALDLGSVFEFMMQQNTIIMNWEITQSSLEDVFLRISQ
jgi:ABC-type multidrug transport system ATPase subunit